MQLTHKIRITFVFLSVLALWGAVVGGLVWYGYDNASAPLTLQPKQPAPMFSLQDQDGRTHRLNDYQNRAVALAFLPNAHSASVTELRSLNRNIQQFDTLGVKVFAIAPIAASTAKRLHDTERLEFPILADKDSRVARQYGAGVQATLDGRASFVIGGDGRVILPVTAVDVAEHGKQLAELSECCLDSKPQPNSKLIGKPIADFRLPRVADGQPETLYGAKRQKATVLFITSSECPCSGKYEGRMAELARGYARQGVRFVAMNSSDGETPRQIADHAQKAGFPFPVLKDEGNVVADRIEARVTPEAFVMDSQGILRYHGRIDDSRDPSQVQSHDLRNALDFLLAGKNPPHTDLTTFGCAILRAPKTARRVNLDPWIKDIERNNQP